MGCPRRAIVMEELVQLGVQALLRVGTCGGLQPDQALGDMIVAMTRGARRLDGDASTSATSRTARRRAGSSARRRARAKETDQHMRVGPIVSSDLFYNPDEGQYERWSKRGVLAVEMEAAVLFTVGALRGVDDRLPAHRQRHRRRGRVHAHLRRRAARGRRPHDARRARDATAPTISAETVFLVNPASDNGATGRRWPQIANAAASSGLEGDTLFSERPGHLGELARRRGRRRREAARRRRRRRLGQRGRERHRAAWTSRSR